MCKYTADADRLRAILAAIRLRIGDVAQFECEHGILATRPCRECGAGVVPRDWTEDRGC